MDGTVTLRAADDAGLTYVERLLDDAGLPSEDVRTTPGSVYLGVDGGERIGCGGIEAYGSDGLLRSVVVEDTHRGRGYGTALCDALEAEAADSDVETLYLLTTTAEAFFAGRGYERVVRSDAPPSIRETTEFSSLCPASATCLRTSL